MPSRARRLLGDQPICRCHLGAQSAERFSSAGFRPLFESEWLGHNPGAHTMLSMDPPEHGKNRTLVNRVFSPAIVTRTEPAIRARIERLTDRLAEQGACEFVGDFATPLTSGVIGDFLALDPSAHGKFKHWSDTMSGITPVPLSAEHADSVRSTVKEMEGYFGSVIDERKQAPGEDLVSRLAKAEIDGQSLSREELIAFLFLLVVAGLDTTVHLISKSIITLSDRPALVAQLRATPALIPRFIEETLRYDPPTHNLFRQATEDSEIAGVRVPAGTFVMVMLASANRDPDEFPDPDRFDLERASQGGVAFGHGALLPGRGAGAARRPCGARIPAHTLQKHRARAGRYRVAAHAHCARPSAPARARHPGVILICVRTPASQVSTLTFTRMLGCERRWQCGQ